MLSSLLQPSLLAAWPMAALHRNPTRVSHYSLIMHLCLSSIYTRLSSTVRFLPLWLELVLTSIKPSAPLSKGRAIVDHYISPPFVQRCWGWVVWQPPVGTDGARLPEVLWHCTIIAPDSRKQQGSCFSCLVSACRDCWRRKMLIVSKH